MSAGDHVHQSASVSHTVADSDRPAGPIRNESLSAALPTLRVEVSTELEPRRRQCGAVSDTACVAADGLTADLSRLKLASSADRICRSKSLSVGADSSVCRCQSTGSSDQLNQYCVQHAIGHGSYGIVKLAYNADDNTHYAMKIIDTKKLSIRAQLMARGRAARGGERKDLVDSGISQLNPLEGVYHEIAILKKLSHPNVVRLVEVLDNCDFQCQHHNSYRHRSRQFLCLVFELLERGPILNVPTDSPLSEPSARRYFRDVVLGLEYLHYQKVIHRDIKPSNLLLSDGDTVKIADFGVCNEFSGPDALLTGTCGSPAFMPPEALQTARRAYSGRCADLWAMGVTLYALVIGRLPFQDANIAGLHRRIRSEPPQPPPPNLFTTLSVPLWQLILGLLDKDPRRRLTMSQLRQHSWLTVQGTAPLPPVDINCRSVVRVTEDEVRHCVRQVSGINTIILVKSMVRRRRFLNPFRGSNSRTQLVHKRSSSAPSVVD